MNKAILQIFTAILVLGLFCGAATAVPSVVADPTPSQNSTVTGTVGETQAFTIPLNETATVNGLRLRMERARQHKLMAIILQLSITSSS